MEILIDNILEKVFGGISTQINIIMGILLVIVGLVIIMKSGERKKTIGWVCVGLGCFIVLSALIQHMFRTA